MIKIIISVYIAAILLIAGFAEAKPLPLAKHTISTDLTALKNQRIRHATKVGLNIADARFDSRREILTLSGNVASECLNTIQPELNFDQRSNSVLVSVTAENANCLNDSRNFYVIAIDIKAFFAENTLNKDAMISFHMDNFTGGDSYSFNYFAKQQMKYSFDTTAHGTVEIDHRTGKFYLIGRGSKIEIMSRIDLHNFVNRFVQLKGLVPSAFTIGEETSPIYSQLIVGQLTVLR